MTSFMEIPPFHLFIEKKKIDLHLYMNQIIGRCQEEKADGFI